jgi:GST-like protein
MILHLADRTKAFSLVPAATSPQRAAFLRWLMFLASAIYPTFTYGDVPERWVGAPKEKGAGKALRTSTDEHRKVLLRFLETQAKGPYFLGKTMTALDLYLWILATWRPGKDWLAANCPKLTAIAAKTAEHPVCVKVMRRNGY